MSAHATTDDSGDQLPRWFGDYVLLKRLGHGGMGQVFLARLPGLQGIDRLCVIKTLRRQWTNDREYVARFVDEARVVVQLNHRNICPVFDVGQQRDTFYLAMDLVPGRDLQAVLQRAEQLRTTVAVDVALQLVAEVLDALDAAHRLTHLEDDTPLNLVHRDVSPHNVLVSFDGDVKLIDFGLAHSALKHEKTEPGVVLGKLAYMAPEHARGELVDRRADLFAVGVVLYELLVGERFWGTRPAAQIWQSVGVGNHVPDRLDRLDVDVRAVVEKAIAALPADRFATAALMRQAIVKAQIARGVVAGSAEVRDVMERLFPGEALADRKERAALQKLAAPSVTVVSTRESTRIAAAPSRPSVPSALPSQALLPTVADVARPVYTGDEAPTFNDRKEGDEDVPTDSVRTETAFERPSSSSSSSSRPRPVPMLAPLPVSPAVASASPAVGTAVVARRLISEPSSPVTSSLASTLPPMPTAFSPGRRRWPIAVGLIVVVLLIAVAVAVIGGGVLQHRRDASAALTTTPATTLATPTAVSSSPPVASSPPPVAMPTPVVTSAPTPAVPVREPPVTHAPTPAKSKPAKPIAPRPRLPEAPQIITHQIGNIAKFCVDVVPCARNVVENLKPAYDSMPLKDKLVANGQVKDCYAHCEAVLNR